MLSDMSETAPAPRDLKLSGKFEPVDEIPLTCVELMEGIEAYDGDVVQCKVAISENGGVKRTRIRPIIKDAGDAAALEIADMAFAIAWTDMKKRGKAARYVAELIVREGDGTVRSSPHRVYFDCKPDDGTDIDEPAETNAPSLTYVRGLEDRVLLQCDRMNRMATRVMMQQDRLYAMAWSGIEAANASKVAESRAEIELEDARGRNRRRDKIFDGVVSFLPHAAARLLPEAGPALKAIGASAGGDEKPKGPPPIERLRELLTSDELDAFKKAVGDETWTVIESAKTLQEAQRPIATASKEVQHAIVDALGEKNVLAIASWEE